MKEVFTNLARHLQARGIELEAVTDKAGRPCSLRIYLDGKAYTIDAERLDDDELRLTLAEFEAEEPAGVDERFRHVLDVVRKIYD